MAIKLPDPGNGIPEQKTGNDEWTNMKIVRENFADQSNAASRLVGINTGNLMEVGAFGMGSHGIRDSGNVITPNVTTQTGIYKNSGDSAAIYIQWNQNNYAWGLTLNGSNINHVEWFKGAPVKENKIYTSGNTTKDGNGFLKAASPVVDLYDNKIELNSDAETQGVKFIKNGTGDYTLQTKTGLRSDNTWRIEIPNDDNRNPLFAVAIDTKDDGTIHIKCYKRIFNMQTFMFEPDLDSPVDIAEGRFISVRLNDNPEPEQTDEPTI